MNYISSEQNKNKVKAIKKIHDFYSSTLYPSQSLLTKEKKEVLEYFKQRSENIDLIKEDISRLDLSVLLKDFNEEERNKFKEMLINEVGERDSKNYHNRYMNMYSKEIELNNYNYKLVKSKISIRRSFITQTKLY